MSKRSILSTALILLIGISCTKNEVLFEPEFVVTGYSQLNAKEDFARILSKAVYESEDIRCFLKKKAIERFDNDSDVFYPYVKNEQVSNGLSFRNALLSYTDDISLSRIESTLPLLTIYVPDLRWIEEDAFCPEAWDVSSEYVIVCVVREDKTISIFFNGDSDKMSKYDGIPLSSSLVIKDNERVRKKINTKGNEETAYEFISTVFDASNNAIETKSSNYRYTGPYSYVYLPGCQDTFNITDNIDITTLGQIAPEAITAYSELRGIPNSSQRDYCYYGMTPTNTVGQLNNYVRDRIFRMRIEKDSIKRLCDSHTGSFIKDPYLSRDIDDDGNKSYSPPSDYNNVLNLLYAGGKLEIEIAFYFGGEGAVQQERLVLDVNPRDLFEIRTIKREQWGSNIIKWYRTWLYTVSDDDIIPKWYYPTTNLRMPAWQLCNGATSVTIEFKEIDSDITTTKKNTINHKYTVGAELKYTPSGEKIGFGIDPKYEKGNSEEVSVTEKTGSDDMGKIEVSYIDPYIKTAYPNAESPEGFTLHSYSTGTVVFSILPEILSY